MSRRFLVALAGIALIAYCVGLVVYSGRFPAPGEDGVAKDHVLLFVGATMLASLLHVGACVAVHKTPPRLRHVLIVGAGVRVLLLFGAPGPILEGDPARQRFDARLVNQGINPYEFAPAHLQDEEPSDIAMTGASIERLTRARAAMTASSDAPRPEDVRRPDLRTNATPLQLWIGALCDRFKPTSTRGFAFAILVADSLAMFFIILALRALSLPVGWVIVYAWCPVLLKEAYCSLSVDAFVMPALAFLVWCLASGKRLLAGVPLALCGGLRFALLALLPATGRRAGILGLMLAAVLLVVPFLPFQAPEVPMRRYVEGNVHVWRHYEYNSILENLLRGAFGRSPSQAENSLTIGGLPLIEPGDALHAFVSKVLGLVVLLAVLIYLIVRWGYGTEDAAESGLSDLFVMIAALLVVSPILTPSQAIWLLPLLAVRPVGLAWLALPALTCLSYLTHLEGPDACDLTILDGEFSYRVFEYGAFAFLLFLDLLWRRRIFPRRIRATVSRDLGAGSPEHQQEPALTY
ncbi:MAG TPA: hypothetical protein VFY93_18585 [Planctomycetota bacterium]|nr:hypothetical protein [Planctomycetota bacterium]